jgi:hypothetical protein
MRINADECVYFWSLAEEIAVLYTAVVWNGKTCGRAASISRLDDANDLLMVVTSGRHYRTRLLG